MSLPHNDLIGGLIRRGRKMAGENEIPAGSTAEHDMVGGYRCLACGKENEPHYEFCLGCGEKLLAPRSLPTLPPTAATQELSVVGAQPSKKAIWIVVALGIALVAAGAVLIVLAAS